jgi:hypothetical protein
MAIYTVHEPPRLTGNAAADADRFIFVRDGFYGWAFLLPPLWMLWHRLWLVLLGYLILTGVLQNLLSVIGVSGTVHFLVTLAISVLVGTEGASLRRFTLARRRYRNVGVVVGDDVEAAERRFFATWDIERGASQGRTQAAPAEARTPPPAGSDVIGLFPQPGAMR